DAFFEERGVREIFKTMNTEDRREEIQAEIDLVMDEAGRSVEDLDELEGWKKAIASARMEAAELMRPPWER
ncbi:hypothetical protein KW792_01275, partial [Candidatus Saccharibacteria bacterium]|nr:hypothetical protein [Candidatus Saccharibacteria bacterium]